MQDRIILHAERWARESRAIFETDKTSLIHFTRRKTTDNTKLITFRNDTIMPQSTVKMLGVTLDKKLNMQMHVTKIANKAMYACIATQRLKGLRPNQARQIYRSCIILIMDYAAST